MPDSAPPPSWQVALGRLHAGNQRYQAFHQAHPRLSPEWRAELQGGQRPFAVILGCADSRVPPEHIFDQGLGDLFVVRVAGHVLDGAVMGSIEFAALQLEVQLVLVLGHENCGAVRATLAGVPLAGHLATLTRGIEPALAAASARDELPDDPAARVNAVARANARLVAETLRSSQPHLNRREAAGLLKVLPAFYHLESGAVEFMDPEP
jgi:carbonic anhydrase